MRRIVVGLQKEAAGDIEIAVIDQTTIDRDKRVSVPTIEQGYRAARTHRADKDVYVPFGIPPYFSGPVVSKCTCGLASLGEHGRLERESHVRISI